MSKKINNGLYYELTDEDQNEIIKYFNERNLKELIKFCSALSILASHTTWQYAESYLKDVGEEKFFRCCRNCGYTFNCDEEFAINECGDKYEKWIPMTEDQEKHLAG